MVTIHKLSQRVMHFQSVLKEKMLSCVLDYEQQIGHPRWKWEGVGAFSAKQLWHIEG